MWKYRMRTNANTSYQNVNHSRIGNFNPRRASRFSQLLRGAAFWVVAVFWLPTPLQAEDFQYDISDGRVAIVGYIGPEENVIIPETIEGLPVNRIVDYAFIHSTLIGITIPDSVTDIDSYAFAYCTALASVTIPASVTSIGAYAFYGCSSL